VEPLYRRVDIGLFHGSRTVGHGNAEQPLDRTKSVLMTRQPGGHLRFRRQLTLRQLCKECAGLRGSSHDAPAEQLLLATEIVVDQRRVQSGGRCNLPGGHCGEPEFCKQVKRAGQDGGLGIKGNDASPRPADCIALQRFTRRGGRRAIAISQSDGSVRHRGC
jgi:hypothetical protein